MGPALKKQELYSYADYLTWKDDKRWQIIDGIPYFEFPAPDRAHQSASGNLYHIIRSILKNPKCRVYSAPFDVRLSSNPKHELEIYNVVQPDISVYCNNKYLDDKGAIGPSDWIIEVLSPSTADYDTHKKLLLYQRYAVKEYWIVDTKNKIIYVHALEEGMYKDAKVFNLDDKIKVTALKGLTIDAKEVFEM